MSEGKIGWGSSDIGLSDSGDVVRLDWPVCAARGCETHGCGCDQSVELRECDEMEDVKAGKEFLVCGNVSRVFYYELSSLGFSSFLEVLS